MSRGGDREGDRVIGVKRLLGLQQGKIQMKKFTHNGPNHLHFYLRGQGGKTVAPEGPGLGVEPIMDVLGGRSQCINKRIKIDRSYAIRSRSELEKNQEKSSWIHYP